METRLFPKGLCTKDIYLGGIRSTSEDSPILPFFFRFSHLMLCICCKVRDLHMSRCVRITKHKQQQRSCILVHNTHKTQEESAESGRSDFTGAIFYFHRYKRSYDSSLNTSEIGSLIFTSHGHSTNSKQNCVVRRVKSAKMVVSAETVAA